MSRADLARELRLSTASLTRLTKPLLAAGLLVENAPARSRPIGGGRPSRPLTLSPDGAHAMGVNLGLGRLHAVVVDLSGTVVASDHLPGDWSDPDRTAQAIAGLAESYGARYVLHGLGVCLGGNALAHRVVERAHFLGWPLTDLARLVERRTGLPTTVSNDVNAYTLAEHWFGVGRGTRDFAVVSIGTGVGLGVVANDELVEGSRGAAGYVGALPAIDGRRYGDVLEIASIAVRATGLLGRQVAPDDLLDGAAADPELSPLLDDVARTAGELMAHVALVTAPEAVLLSGEGAALVADRTDLVNEGAQRLRLAENPWRLVVNPAGFGEWARGAAVLGIRSHMTRRA